MKTLARIIQDVRDATAAHPSESSPNFDALEATWCTRMQKAEVALARFAPRTAEEFAAKVTAILRDTDAKCAFSLSPATKVWRSTLLSDVERLFARPVLTEKAA